MTLIAEVQFHLLVHPTIPSTTQHSRTMKKLFRRLLPSRQYQQLECREKLSIHEKTFCMRMQAKAESNRQEGEMNSIEFFRFGFKTKHKFVYPQHPKPRILNLKNSLNLVIDHLNPFICRIKERDIRLRMKFQDPEKPLRRRRQSDRTESGDLSSSSSTHESYQHSSGISVGGDRDYYIHTISSNDANKTRSSSIDSSASDVFESSNRRMSSPLQSAHSAGVVTASLKIPVQSSASSSQNIQFYLQGKSGHNIGDHIVDIPFIEDNSSSFEFPDEGIIIFYIIEMIHQILQIILVTLRNNTQTTVFPQRPQSVTVTTKRLDEVQKVNAPQSQESKQTTKTTLSIKEQISSTSATPTTSKHPKPEARKSSLAKIQMSSSSGHISTPGVSSTGTLVKAVRESNYTPSISSIGSVLLRSKTADFERIMSDKNKKSRISTTAPTEPKHVKSTEPTVPAKIQPQANPITNRNMSAKTSITPIKKAESEPKMPIYKRQQIISSVQKQK